MSGELERPLMDIIRPENLMVLKSLDKIFSQLSSAQLCYPTRILLIARRLESTLMILTHSMSTFPSSAVDLFSLYVYSVCMYENLTISELACVCLWYFLFTYILISITLKCGSCSQSRDSARWITGEHQENHHSPNTIG